MASNMWSRAAVCVATLFLVAPVFAQQAPDKAAQAAVAKAQFMLRQVSGEKAALEAKNHDLQTQIDALTKKAAVMVKEQQVAELGKEKLSDQVSGVKEKYVALVNKYNELREAYIAEKKRGQSDAAKMDERDAFIKQCVDSNKKLFTINQEILGKYEHKGFWDVINQKEPLTGLSQVELENMVQDYQFENEDARVNEKQVPKKPAADKEAQGTDGKAQ